MLLRIRMEWETFHAGELLVPGGLERVMEAAGSGRPDGGVLTDRQGGQLSRLVLGVRLRRLREQRRMTRLRAATAIRASESKISRMESGRNAFTMRDVADLCTLYGVVDHAERAELLALARQANLPAWWEAYDDVLPGWLHRYLGLEQAAEIIRSYEVQFVPGLLQTPDYARGVITLAHGNVSAQEIDRRIELRMRRQEILHRQQPTRIWALIDEAALRRPVGGRAAMFRQLEHLVDASELPHVTVQIVQFNIGGHAGVGGPVTMLRLPHALLPEFVYLEQLDSGIYPERESDIDFYRHTLNRLALEAASAGETPTIIRGLIKEL